MRVLPWPSRRPPARPIRSTRPRPVKKLLLLFTIPAALFAAQLPLTAWRFHTLDCLPRAALATLVEALFTLVAASGVGALCLLLYFLHCLLKRRSPARPAAAFLAPTLVAFTLFAAIILWANIGIAIEHRALARMNTAWDAANPQTQADVRALFGDPDVVEPDWRDGAPRWLYYPSRFPSPHILPYQVWFAPDGTITHHGSRS